MELSSGAQKQTMIKSMIHQRFGIERKPGTNELRQKPYEKIDLAFLCPEVSRITNQVVGGKIKTHSATGRNPEIKFQNKVIAYGDRLALHLYVVDENENVWDPVTETWGSMKEKEYLELLK